MKFICWLLGIVHNAKRFQHINSCLESIDFLMLSLWSAVLNWSMESYIFYFNILMYNFKRSLSTYCLMQCLIISVDCIKHMVDKPQIHSTFYPECIQILFIISLLERILSSFNKNVYCKSCIAILRFENECNYRHGNMMLLMQWTDKQRIL